MRNSRGFGRLLAGWLLLWFVAMAATPPLPQATAPAAPVASTVAGDLHADCGSQAHEAQADGHHAGHALHQPNAQDGAAADAHGGHASGSAVHCPLCLHAGAPPQAAAAQPAPGDAPGLQLAAADSPSLRVRSDAPAPGRGPPRFS